MKLTEAIDRYYEDKNADRLYENVVRSGLKFEEMIEVLKDTLNENYNEDGVWTAIENLMQEDLATATFLEATDKDFE